MDYMQETGEIEWKREKRAYVYTKNQESIEDIDKLCDEFPIGNLPAYYRLRIIVDFISSMTDKFAVMHYQKLSGQRI